MPNLVPSSRTGDLTPTVGVGVAGLANNDRRTSRALQSLQRNTIVRMASVQGHAIVQNEKLHEIDRLSREAMSGQAMLAPVAHHARIDPGAPLQHHVHEALLKPSGNRVGGTNRSTTL